MQGDLGRLTLQLKGRGDHLVAIVRTLDVRLDLAQAHLSYGNVEGGRPVDFRLDELRMAIPAGSRLTGSARGSLLGEVLSARFSGGDLPTLTREIRWPLGLEARTKSATFHLDGVLAPPEAEQGTDVRFRMSASRAGDVASWLGPARGASVPVAIEGHARVESDEWRLSPFTARLGRTAMSAELARVGIGRQPLIQARLVVESVDAQELQSLFPPPDPKAPPKSIIDLPILPAGIDLYDADVDVKVKRIDMQPAPVHDISFAGHIREGRMWPSPFSATLAGATFLGAITLDLRSAVPEASVWVAAEKVDVGYGIMARIKLDTDLQGLFSLHMDIEARAPTLDALMQHANGRIDFAAWPRNFAFRLVPTAKSPQFFSLATPIGISGTITDFKIGVSGSDVLETTARLFTSVIVVPLQSLVGRKLPRDGADVCDSAMRAEGR